MPMAIQTPQSGEKPRDIKLNNRRIVLDLLRRHDKVTLGELAQSCALSRNTIKKCMDYFLEKGLAADAGKGSSTSEGGKKPDMYKLCESWGCVIGFYVTAGCVEGTLYSIGMTELANDKEDYLEYTPSEIVACCGRLASRLLKKHPESGALRAATCSIHGVVDIFTGRVLSGYPFSGQKPSDNGSPWNGSVPLGDMLQSALGVPVRCCNPVRSMLRCEASLDPAVSENSALIFTRGAAPMAALIREGRLVQGKRCVLGEISGIPLNSTANPDTGGSLGGDSLGTLICHKRLLEEIGRHPAFYASSVLSTLGHEPSLKDIFDAAEKGDELARAAVRHAAKWFAGSIRQFLFLADPDIILIQGDYADAGEYFLETLRGYVKSYAAPAVSVIPVIRLSTLSDNESCRLGGGLIAVNHVFNQDEIYE